MSDKQPWCRDRNLFSTRFKVDPARRAEFLAAFEELCSVGATFYERGCAFAFQGWARDPDEFVVFASWDEAVVGELRATATFQACNQRMMDCCTGPVVMEQFAGLDTDRSIFAAYPAGKSQVHQPGKVQEYVFL